VILPVDLGRDLTKLLEAVLKERRGSSLKVSFGTADGAQGLIDMANENAKSHFADYVSKSERKKEALELIQKKLGLPELPYRIECYDISNIQGQETVASQVVFEDGIPNKDQYRRYKIRTV